MFLLVYRTKPFGLDSLLTDETAELLALRNVTVQIRFSSRSGFIKYKDNSAKHLWFRFEKQNISHLLRGNESSMALRTKNLNCSHEHTMGR